MILTPLCVCVCVFVCVRAAGNVHEHSRNHTFTVTRLICNECIPILIMLCDTYTVCSLGFMPAVFSYHVSIDN